MSSDTLIYWETWQTINSLAYTLIKKGQNQLFKFTTARLRLKLMIGNLFQ